MVPQKKREIRKDQLEIQLIACHYLKNVHDNLLLKMLLKKLPMINNEKAQHIERLKNWNRKRNKNRKRLRSNICLMS